MTSQEQEMVRKAAEAICEAEGMNPNNWLHKVNAARAAIEAMRKPTPEMLLACWPTYHPWGSNAPDPVDRPDAFQQMEATVERYWQLMLSEALRTALSKGEE